MVPEQRRPEIGGGSGDASLRPCVGSRAGLVNACKPGTPGAEDAVESFDAGVLDGLSGLDVHQAGVMRVAQASNAALMNP